MYTLLSCSSYSAHQRRVEVLASHGVPSPAASRGSAHLASFVDIDHHPGVDIDHHPGDNLRLSLESAHDALGGGRFQDIGLDVIVRV